MGGGREQVLSPFFSTLTLLAGKVRITLDGGFSHRLISIYLLLFGLAVSAHLPAQH